MKSQDYLLRSFGLTSLLYDSITNWDDKLQFARLNTQSHDIAFNRSTDLVYDVVSRKEVILVNHLPATTATKIRFNNMLDLEHVLFYQLFNRNVNCNKIIINIEHNLNTRAIEKVTKACAKHGVDLVVESSPDKQAFEELMDKQVENYQHLYHSYTRRASRRSVPLQYPSTSVSRLITLQYPAILSSRSISFQHSAAAALVPRKRKEAESELIEVPLDPVKRMKFFAAELNKLVQGNTSSISLHDEQGGLVLPRYFNGIANVSGPFRQYNKTILEANLNHNYLTLKPNYISSCVNEVASIFIDCVIRFDDFFFYVTSTDVFLHNHITIDDCAYGLDVEEYSIYPTAAVTRKQYITRLYYELSIFFGFFEVLITGGYYCKSGASPFPFLGSSLSGWQFDIMKEGVIYTSAAAQTRQIVPTERLLIQYNRRNAHNLWGFHNSCSYLQNFSPITPLHMKAHTTQKDKGISTHHFASELLNLVSSRKWTTHGDVFKVFLFLSSSSKFKGICQKSNSNAVSFVELKMALDGLANKPIYFSFLVNFAVEIEQAVNEFGSCYLFNIHTINDYGKKVLNIMKNGLKGELDKEISKIVSSEKVRLHRLS